MDLRDDIYSLPHSSTSRIRLGKLVHALVTLPASSILQIDRYFEYSHRMCFGSCESISIDNRGLLVSIPTVDRTIVGRNDVKLVPLGDSARSAWVVSNESTTSWIEPSDEEFSLYCLIS